MPRITAGAARLANRQLVLALCAQEPDLKSTAIGKRLGLAESTVRSILSRFAATSGSSSSSAPTPLGRPPKHTKRWKRCDPQFSIVMVNQLLYSCHSALGKMVSRDPFLSAKQLAAAMFDWEKDMVDKLPLDNATYERPQRSSKSTIRRYNSHSKAIMMHLVIEKGGDSRLTLCDPLQDSASYQATVLTPNLAFIKAGEYMHDGAPSHTSRSTVAFLAAKGVKVLPDWPPNSPDLNPVEHCWSWISQQLVGKKIRNANELEAAVRQAWAAKPADLIPKLCGSMVRRLTAVQVAKGAATKY